MCSVQKCIWYHVVNNQPDLSVNKRKLILDNPFSNSLLKTFLISIWDGWFYYKSFDWCKSTARKMHLPSEEVNASATQLHQISRKCVLYGLRMSDTPSSISPVQIPW